MEFPKRKSPRIPGYSYGTPNCYFITICTFEKKCIFGEPGILSKYGIIAEECLRKIPEYYPNISIDQSIVMPNHIHVLFTVQNGGAEETSDLTTVIGQYKMSVTKIIRGLNPKMQVWQRSFHDHVIRSRTAYERIWEYIKYNPMKWEEDCFYCKEIVD